MGLITFLLHTITCITLHYMPSSYLSLHPPLNSWLAPHDVCIQFKGKCIEYNCWLTGLGRASPDHLHLTLSNSIWIFCINDNWKGPSCIRTQLCHWMPQSLSPLRCVTNLCKCVLYNRVFTFILARHQREKLKQFPPCFRTLIVNWLTFRSFDVWLGILVFLPPVNTHINNK